MSVDMTKWQEIAKKNVFKRPAGIGRLAGKITIVTGAAPITPIRWAFPI